jgi:hypothetical protein
MTARHWQAPSPRQWLSQGSETVTRRQRPGLGGGAGPEVIEAASLSGIAAAAAQVPGRVRVTSLPANSLETGAGPGRIRP